MATSFRFPPEKMSRLELLAKRLGKSKAQVVLQAIDKLYESELQVSKRSLLDQLQEGGFEPTDADWGDLSSNKQRQRQVIREKLSKKNRS
jgi:predicted DNA-binding protein